MKTENNWFKMRKINP